MTADEAKAKLDEALFRLGFTGPLETAEAGIEALDFLLAELTRKDEALRAADSALAACGCVWTGGCRNQKILGPCTVCAARDLIAAALGEQP